jgi:hypothetical protein
MDAATFHAYVPDQDETKFILGGFHRVRNPRLMIVDYFEVVLTKYDELAEEESLP